MVRGTSGGVALMAIAVGFVFGSSRMWLPAGWGGVIGLGVSGCAGWALAYIGDAAIRDWATGLLAAVAGVSGLVIWIRSLDLDLADRQWRRRRVQIGRAACRERVCQYV